MDKFLSLIIVLVITFSGCEEPFDRPKDIQGGVVVIYGRVSNLQDDSFIEVGITRNKTSKPVEVDGATVRLYDAEGEITEFCNKGLGIYVPTNIEFKGRVGMEYNMQVILPDGREYAAYGQKVLPPTVIDSAYTKFVKKEVRRDTENSSILNFMELSIDADLLDISEEKFVRWDLEETFTILQTAPPGAMRFFICFIAQDMSLQKVNLASTSSFTNPQVNGIILGDRLLDYAFGVKHATEFYQRTLNEDTYNYWTDIEKVSTISGSIFDNPPAPVFGNVANINNSEEVVLGYFEATGTSRRRVFNYGNEIEEPQSDPCRWSGFVDRFPGYCLNCLSHPNSSYEFESWYVLNEEF